MPWFARMAARCGVVLARLAWLRAGVVQWANRPGLELSLATLACLGHAVYQQAELQATAPTYLPTYHRPHPLRKDTPSPVLQRQSCHTPGWLAVAVASPLLSFVSPRLHPLSHHTHTRLEHTLSQTHDSLSPTTHHNHKTSCIQDAFCTSHSIRPQPRPLFASQ